LLSGHRSNVGFRQLAGKRFNNHIGHVIHFRKWRWPKTDIDVAAYLAAECRIEVGAEPGEGAKIIDPQADRKAVLKR
ncbi:MAG: hypothetical protein QG638_1931, partial [Pseudomonadota bacterium]|nr:hypothetical protein [Pseudomonadota bacterium]